MALGDNQLFNCNVKKDKYMVGDIGFRKIQTNVIWPLSLILTHLAYIANGKKRVILCNNFTGRISVTLLCGICDVSYPTKQR